MNDNRDFGKMLKRQRNALGLTVLGVADASGVSPSHLCRIERGERFPSAGILQKIAKPLGFEEDEILTYAGYRSPRASTSEREPGGPGRLDSYVARVLAQEPVEIQRTVVGIVAILKPLARVGNPAEWPEFREYSRRKYPELDEDLITMIEDLIERSADKEKRG